MATATISNLAVIPRIKWINLNKAKQSLQLPDPWPVLVANGFHEDLVDRAYAHLAYCTEYGGLENAEVVLAALGVGFVDRFERSRFEPVPGDPHHVLKMRSLDALVELSEFYGDRVSSVVWKSLAYLACRADPEVEQSIIQADATGDLPYSYTLVDSALHATGSSTRS